MYEQTAQTDCTVSWNIRDDKQGSKLNTYDFTKCKWYDVYTAN